MPVHDPAEAKQLLAEAGYPNGFDAGEFYCDGSYANLGEALLDNLLAVGIRAKLRPLERSGIFFRLRRKKVQKHHPVCQRRFWQCCDPHRGIYRERRYFTYTAATPI